MTKLRMILALVLAAVSMTSPAYAWWNKDWKYRKAVTVDTSPSGLNVSGQIGRTVLLVKLTSGNFTFTEAMQNGADVRIVDTDDKTRERSAVFQMFNRQLHLGADVNSERAKFPGGSIVEFVSAGSNRLGASGSYQRLLLSELSFWPSHVDTYGSLTATLSLDGFCEIDTTCDIQAGSGQLARRLWRDASNRYEKLFFPVELHEEYRADPDLISDQEWQWAQAEGFTRRDAARSEEHTSELQSH